jgi:hypothetical protein
VGGRGKQLLPIRPLAAGDHVVNGGQGDLLMGEVPVSHNVIIQAPLRSRNHEPISR